MFPDRATLYITAIEDRQYKEEKINCKFFHLSNELLVLHHSSMIAGPTVCADNF